MAVFLQLHLVRRNENAGTQCSHSIDWNVIRSIHPLRILQQWSLLTQLETAIHQWFACTVSSTPELCIPAFQRIACIARVQKNSFLFECNAESKWISTLQYWITNVIAHIFRTCHKLLIRPILSSTCAWNLNNKCDCTYLTLFTNHLSISHILVISAIYLQVSISHCQPLRPILLTPQPGMLVVSTLSLYQLLLLLVVESIYLPNFPYSNYPSKE